MRLKKIAQNVAISIFCDRGKKNPNFMCYFLNFHKDSHSNESPNGRKFAQSGHPVPKLKIFLTAQFVKTMEMHGKQI
jgi:hypothetical protein